MKRAAIVLLVLALLMGGVVAWDTQYAQYGSQQSFTILTAAEVHTFDYPIKPVLATVKLLSSDTNGERILLTGPAFGTAGVDTVFLTVGDVYEYSSNTFGLTSVGFEAGAVGDSLQCEGSN